jgi:porin
MQTTPMCGSRGVADRASTHSTMEGLVVALRTKAIAALLCTAFAADYSPLAAEPPVIETSSEGWVAGDEYKAVAADAYKAVAADVPKGRTTAFKPVPSVAPTPYPVVASHQVAVPYPVAVQKPVVDSSSEVSPIKAGTIVKLEAGPTVKEEDYPYAGGLTERLRLTGDWGGFRTEFKQKGLTFDLYSTQFYQGVVSGGRDDTWEYGHKLDYLLNADLGKMCLVKGGSLYLHGETRFGNSINEADGLFLPANLPLQFPDSKGDVSALTAIKYTQALSEQFVVFGGKLNTLDDYVLKYSPGMGANLPGLNGFMNTGLVFNPIVMRTVPYSTTGFGAAFLRNEKPFVSVSLLDPDERATTGFEDSYDRGVVVTGDLTVETCLFDMPGLINVGGVYSTARYRAIDPSAYFIRLPLRRLRDAGVVAPEKEGSWALYANHYQALWVDECDKRRTWGVFGQYGISDGNPNPIHFVANFGVGGRSPIRCRTYDTFGAGFFFTGLSDEFKALAAAVLPQQDEYGVELFYNYAVTPWCRLTGDVQFARPSTVGLDIAVIAGSRLQILF